MKQRKSFGVDSTKTIKQIIVTHAVLLALFAGIAYTFAQEETGAVACTMDAKECPDGTFVGRTGPSCEFAPCPSGGPGEVIDDTEAQPENNNGQQADRANGQANKLEAGENDRNQAQDKKPVFEENMAERKAALQARTQERIRNLAANVSNRFDATIARLLNITERLASRSAKLAANGIDTTNADADIQAARTALNNALTSISNIDNQVASAVSSDNIKTSWQEVRTTFTNTNSELQSSRVALRSALAALKQAVTASPDNAGVSSAVKNQNATNSTESIE